MKNKKNNFGQGMTEYLIIVALIAVSAIAVTRGLSQNMKIGFGKISNALQGEEAQKGSYHKVTDREVNGKDMGDFNAGVKR